MPPARSATTSNMGSLKRSASRESSVEKGLPSLNELFPEDLFRGSFPQPSPQQPSASILPLSISRADSQSHLATPRPRSPTDAHPASRGGRRSPATIVDAAQRTHPRPPAVHAARGPTPSSPPPPPPPPPPRGPSTEYATHAYHHTFPPARTTGSPSHIPHATARSIRSPADELVSVVTGAQASLALSLPPAPPPQLPSRQFGSFERNDIPGGNDVRGPWATTRPPHASSTSYAGAPTHAQAAYYPHEHGHGVGPSSRGDAFGGNGGGGRGKGRFDEGPQYARAPSSAASAVAAGSGRGKAAATTTTDDSERRHCCPHCNKRFNRPSSLAIHVNTHTGAKPFTCAFPGCNRKFNVNSNMRRHYRNHLTPRRPHTVSRMAQPPSVPQGAPGMSMHAYAGEPLLRHPSPHHHPHPSGTRSGSIPTSISPSVSRSSSYSPSPASSRSPSPLPSPVSAVTSPFPPTPRSLPSTSFRNVSPARYPQHPLQPYYQHHQSYSQPPAATYASPSLKPRPEGGVDVHVDVTMARAHAGAHRAPSPPWSTSEYEADELDGPAHAESFVRGARVSSERQTQTQTHTQVHTQAQLSSLWDRRPRPRAESSPESRRARPYPSPRERPHRGFAAGAREQSESEDGDGDEDEEGAGAGTGAGAGAGGSEACDVPGCGCSAGGRGVGTPRLRPAFQDLHLHGHGHGHTHSGWTVLEGASEDG